MSKNLQVFECWHHEEMIEIVIYVQKYHIVPYKYMQYFWSVKNVGKIIISFRLWF